MSDSASRFSRLATEPCQSRCDWLRTDERRRPLDTAAELALFRCTGCGSEWVSSEQWSPANADGSVPPDVAEAVSLRNRHAPA